LAGSRANREHTAENDATGRSQFVCSVFAPSSGRSARAKQVALLGTQQYLRMEGIKAQFSNGIVSSVSFVSTTNTARSLAGSVSLALALTRWRSPGISEKLCPALYVVTGPSLT
jgi:hypothetical protein